MNLQEYYKSRKEMVDKAVRIFLEKEGILDVSPTPLGGKRLRGVLTILVCEALGGKAEDALDAAVAVELAHAASLDADDIVDLDTIRRGKPATWVLKGVIKTVVGTHGLVAAAFDLVRRYGMEAVEVFTDTYMKMVRGEVRDVLSGGFYEAIIGAKTASLWAAGAALGALAAGKGELVGVAREYGYATGMAFQIADDIVDIARAVEGGEASRVLAHPSSMAFLAYIGLESIVAVNPLQVLTGGLKRLEEHMKNKALEKLNEWIEKARSLAGRFPDSEYKPLLQDYPSMAVDLMFREAGWLGERQ